ncbi:MAG: type IV pilus twitching motility protein PilT [Pseudomonadota bacterium]
MKHTLKDLLVKVVEQKGSDLHINAGLPPQIRVDGRLQPVGDSSLTAEESQEICYECLSQEQVMRFEADRAIDLGFGMKGLARFRANVFWSIDQVAGAFRVIPFDIPKPDFLGLPESMLKIITKSRGLVLVTGQTGSGKSTTLASLIDRINETRSEHIVTIEDPIEYLYTQKKSLINQREVGHDALSFTQALKHILRQDPDVVLVGEMRDLETIQATITVAETGHLVFATLHTNSAVETIDRIIDVFPPHQQNQVRTQLAFILEGVFCQQLLPKVKGGRTLALEILLPNSGIRNLIREGKTHQLFAQMQMGQQESQMVTLDQSLAKLAKGGIIEIEEARRRAKNVEDFNGLLK